MNKYIKTVTLLKEADEKWIQKAVPEEHEGEFNTWCKKHGFGGVSQQCINKAAKKDPKTGKSMYPDASRMANFAVNVSKGKYTYPKHESVEESVECNYTQQVDPKELEMGIEVEKEHTSDPKLAEKIARDHLAELPDYYTRLKKMEKGADVKESVQSVKELNMSTKFKAAASRLGRDIKSSVSHGGLVGAAADGDKNAMKSLLKKFGKNFRQGIKNMANVSPTSQSTTDANKAITNITNMIKSKFSK